MIESSLQHFNRALQATKDGSHKVQDRYIRNFVQELISDKAKPVSWGYQLLTSSLTHAEKKLFLLYIVGSTDFEWFCKTPTRLQAGIDEYEDSMQEHLDRGLEEYTLAEIEEGRNPSC